MAHKAIGTRGSRTQAALQRAFKSLLQTRSYESIAVDEICKAANVGRSTFYTHYRSKDDLKRSGLEALRHQLIARQKKPGGPHSAERSPPMSFTFDLFAHARDHLDHYRTLAGGRGGTVVLRKLRDTVTDLVCSSRMSLSERRCPRIIHSMATGQISAMIRIRVSPRVINARQ